MRCQDAKRLIKPYLEGTIKDADLRDFITHCRECPSCRDELEIYSAIYYTLSENKIDNYDFDGHVASELDRRMAKLESESRMRRIMAVFVFLAELAAAVSVVFAVIPRDYKEIVKGLLEFFWW